MIAFQIEPAANAQLDEIYSYTVGRWGVSQANRYLDGLFDQFTAIVEQTIVWRSIPAALGVHGYFCRYEQHYVYWRLDDGQISIVSILHQKMDQQAGLSEGL